MVPRVSVLKVTGQMRTNSEAGEPSHLHHRHQEPPHQDQPKARAERYHRRWVRQAGDIVSGIR